MSKDTEKLGYTNLTDYLLKDKKPESSSWADQAIEDVPEQPAVKKSAWAVPAPLTPGQEVQWPEPPKKPERTAYVSPTEEYRSGGGRGRGSRYPRDDSGDRRRDGKEFREARPPREPTPMPTSPPWTAFVGNLSYDITDQHVWDFFENLKVKTVRLMTQEGKPRGFGYVEFEDLESLQEALQCSGRELLNRNVKIDIADRKEDSSYSREPRGDRPKRDSSSNFWGSGRFDSMKQDRETRTDRSRGPTTGFLGRPLDSPSERPRLDLKPRGTTYAEGETGSNADKPKINPFGDAKPVDTKLTHTPKDGGAFRKTTTPPEQSRPGPGRGRGPSLQEGETRNWRNQSGGRGEGGFGYQSGGRGESETKESRSRPKPKPAEPKKKSEVSNNRFAALAITDGDADE